MLWIALILLLALAGGFLGTVLEVALWAVVLMVVGFALLGVGARAAFLRRTDETVPG